MQVTNRVNNCLGLESFEALGFKSEDDLNIEILKLIKVRSEFLDNSEVISN